MSLFAGNSPRKSGSGEVEAMEEAPRSETTHLGNANQALSNRADVFSRITPEAERKSPAPANDPAPASLTPLDSPTPPDRCANIVAAGARWQGTLNLDDSVRIDGTFSGEVRSKGTVHVSEGARVDAKIRAQFVVVQGMVKGEIRCVQRVELQPKSRVSGEVITKLLSVQEGAVLDSSVQMGATPEADGGTPPPKASRGKSRSGQQAQRAEESAEQTTETPAATPGN